MFFEIQFHEHLVCPFACLASFGVLGRSWGGPGGARGERGGIRRGSLGGRGGLGALLGGPGLSWGDLGGHLVARRFFIDFGNDF